MAERESRPSARAHFTFALRLATSQTSDSRHARQQAVGPDGLLASNLSPSPQTKKGPWTSAQEPF